MRELRPHEHKSGAENRPYDTACKDYHDGKYAERTEAAQLQGGV
jgi:hypothetical protein